MHRVALEILTGDRAKDLGLVFGIGFAPLLMSRQVSIVIGLMPRAASQIVGVREADVWAVHPRVRYIDEIEALPHVDLSRVHGVDGAGRDVPPSTGNAVVRSTEGPSRQAILMGLDDGPPAGRARARGGIRCDRGVDRRVGTTRGNLP